MKISYNKSINKSKKMMVKLKKNKKFDWMIKLKDKKISTTTPKKNNKYRNEKQNIWELGMVI